jgi:hypothetical protein
MLFKIKTGYIQTDENGSTSNTKAIKNKRWELMRLIFMEGKCVSLLYRKKDTVFILNNISWFTKLISNF